MFGLTNFLYKIFEPDMMPFISVLEMDVSNPLDVKPKLRKTKLEADVPIVSLGTGGGKKTYDIFCALKNEFERLGIPYKKIGYDYPRNHWLLWNNTYITFSNYDLRQPNFWDFNGGSVIPTEHGFMVSESSAKSPYEYDSMTSAMEDLLGIRMYKVPAGDVPVDIDPYINYIRWKNILVIDKAYRMSNRQILKPILENFDVVTTTEPYAPNFVPYEPAKKVILYGSPKLQVKLEKKGVEAVNLGSDYNHALISQAGAHCLTNTFHDVGILENMFRDDWFFKE